MKPSTRSLTGFNRAIKEMIGTIRLPVYAGGVTRSVKFSVIKSKAPYNAILGTPWLHSMRAVPSTYHQCIKFPNKDGRIFTIKGDQQAARDIMVATVKIQCATSHVNSTSKQIHKVYPQKEEVIKVAMDECDPSKTVCVGAYLADDMTDRIVSFLRANTSTFAWTTSDMRGIHPIITTH